MKPDLYDRLMTTYGSRDAAEEMVNLYAEGGLSEGMTNVLEAQAANDEELMLEMTTLKTTVDLLQSDPGPIFSEETYQRILLKMQSRGAQLPVAKTTPSFWQYQLPIQG